MVSVETPTQSTESEVRELTGGQALYHMLKREGVDTVFALPGVQLDGFFDALYDGQNAGEIRVVHTRHEQAAAYMADGYARSTGKMGVCVVVPGPGLMNAMAGLATSYATNAPVLCVTGQIKSDMIEFGRGLLHEIPNQLEMVRSATKHAARAMTPQDVPAMFHGAVNNMWSGRVRPVEIEVPPDVFFAKGEVRLLPGSTKPVRAAGDPDLLAQAAKLLGNAKNPVIYAGGGINGSGANAELLALAELLQAPVIITSNGKGAISDRHPLAQNNIADQTLRDKADVILVIGTRFVDASAQARVLGSGQSMVQIDIDPEEVGRNTKPTLGIEADAKAALVALVDLVGRQSISRPSRLGEFQALKDGIAARVNAVNPQAEFALAIRAELPDNGIFVSEMTQIGYWSYIGYPVYQPRTFITPGYQGTLGWGFPTSLGVKVANPDTPVVSVNGDGGFGFCLNELATMAQHNIPTTVVVFNDSAYGNVKRIQQEDMGGRTIASDLKNPDYMKLAEAFGIRSQRLHTGAELRTALNSSFKANEPTLIEVPVGPMPNPWKVLGLR